MISQINKNNINLNFLYYIGFFFALIASFEYGHILYEYARFVLGFTAFAKSIILSSVFMGVIVSSFILIKFTNKKNVNPKMLVYNQVFMLFYIVASNFLFQKFIFEDISYLLQICFSIILLFLYGNIFGIVLILFFKFLLNKEDDKALKIYNYFFIIFFSISVTSLFNVFYFIEHSNNIQNGFLFTSIVIVISILFLISYFIFSINKNDSDYFIGNIENSKNSSIVLFICLLLISCFATIYFFSSSRLLELAYGSSLQIRAIIISSFFLSLALGSLIFKFKNKFFSNSINSVGTLCLLSSIFGLLSLVFYTSNFDIAAFLQKALDRNDYGYEFFIISTFFIILLNYFFTFFITGAVYPIITNITRKKSTHIITIGSVLISSIIGLVIGVLFTYSIGFVYFGSKYLLIFAVFLNILASLLLFSCHKDFLSKKLFLLVLLVIALLIYSSIYSQGYNSVNSPALFKNDAEQGFFNDYNFEGRNSTVNIRAQKRIYNSFDPLNGPMQKIINKSKLTKNGVPFVSTEMYNESLDNDEVVSILFSAFALGLSLDAKKVLSIGFESGFSQSLLLSDKNLEKLDIIEIESGVVEAALLFGDKVKAVYEDSRSNIIINDVINYLKSNKEKYNIIASTYEITYFPEDSFVFTEEFYNLSKKHLQENGLLIQKIDISSSNFKSLGVIFKSLSFSFKYYSAFFADNNRLIIVASNTKIPEFTKENFDKLSFSQFLKLADINSIEDLKNRYVGNQDILSLLFANGVNQVNSYFNKYSENSFGKDIFNNKKIKEISYINDNNLISFLTNIQKVDGNITESKYFNKTKYYKEAQNLYNGIMFNPANLNNSEFFLLLAQNNYCLNMQNKWFEAFVKASKYMMIFLPESEGQNVWLYRNSRGLSH